MKECVIIARRYTTGKERIAECISAYPASKNTGTLVGNEGGAFVKIYVTNATVDNPIIQDLIAPWFIDNPKYTINSGEDQYIPHPDYNHKKYLQPVKEGDEFFYELLTTRQISVTIEQVAQYIRERS